MATSPPLNFRLRALLFNELAKSLDSTLSCTAPWVSIVQPNHVCKIAPRGEDGPRCYADVVTERASMQGERFRALRQLHPKLVATAWPHPTAAGREIRLEGRHQLLLLPFKCATQFGQVAIIDTTCQVPGNGRLDRDARCQ